MDSIERNARAVLLPAIDGLELTDDLKRYFDEGGRCLLLGETRAEYVSRRMSDARRASERAQDFRRLADEVASRADRVMIALDQEPTGIERLHGLVPSFGDRAELLSMQDEAIRQRAHDIGRKAKELGVGMFLGPVVDVLTGRNSWLQGRTLDTDARQVARIAKAFIGGVQSAGIVATAKHFPGHHDITGDPAVELADVRGTAEDLLPGFGVFRSAIEAGIRAIMTGPALVPAVDPQYPSSRSEKTINMLRHDFGFAGIIVSDDIDAVATLRGLSDGETAVAAVKAGADLILLPAGRADEVAMHIVTAVRSGDLPEHRLADAVRNVETNSDALQ
ncbi:glycoside hydrolase family 3 protein [Mesorhizobium sp. YC-39]|uniref:glycoside hydrolase family 3 N-terminal domain-containing protein n=1 Tax=unclassified Mesorhizobium TaxID=325217 RepID=UPI0021E929A4|nr:MULTISPECIES: glycoside hydrolase family 3 N-terminal domain-containing protein [unclassified Mesorhizobium]MCV3205332.1 glycoside hydrolase family 3 protein [Mesorhizobium sp. YC-2]MCV3228269.1 glycoside hydrolase family 3 protein [Mesorhizobium sp. YC-39]